MVANPRKPTFNVTAKGLTLDNDHISELSWPFFAIYGILLFAGLVAAYRYMFEPGVDSLMLVVGIWNEALDLDGVPAEGATTVPGVQRVLKAANASLDNRPTGVRP